MDKDQIVFLAINIIGGLLVLFSYYRGIKSKNGINAFWGGVPNKLRGVYTISMLLSASSFFIFSAYIFKNLGTELLAKDGASIYLLSFAVIQIASAMWMPLVDMMVSRPSKLLWVAIRGALAVVGLAAVAIFVLLLNISPTQTGLFYYSTLVALVIFILHTGILDAIVWPYFWKK